MFRQEPVQDPRLTAFLRNAQHGHIEDFTDEDGDLCQGLKSQLEQGLKINDIDDNGETALIQAVKNNQIDAVEFLLARGANVTIKGHNQFAAIHHAANNGYDEVAIKLIEKDSTIVNDTSAGGWTPLHFAAYHDHYKVAEYLVTNGANINATISEDGEEWVAQDLAGEEIRTLINSQAPSSTFSLSNLNVEQLAERRAAILPPAIQS